MPISYKNKIYTTLGTPTELSGEVVSTTDSAGVPAKDYTVKGKTIVWNQLLDKSKFPETTTRNGVTFTNNGDGTITVNGTATANADFKLADNTYKILANHKCLITGGINGDAMVRFSGDPTGLWKDKGVGVITNQTVDTTAYNFSIRINSGTTVSNLVFKPQLFDLTQMFGAGNEPTTVAQFRAMFPDDYYPYNEGELKSIMPTSVEASGVERFQLLDKSKFPETTTRNGVTFTNNGDGTITVNGTADAAASATILVGKNLSVIQGHKYYATMSKPIEHNNFWLGLYDNSGDQPFQRGTVLDRNGRILDCIKSSDTLNCQVALYKNKSVSNAIVKPQLFDLTQMFGPGNEPATVAEFWQRVPEKLYSYNPDAYKRVNIPSSKYFPDGMRSAGSVYDEINFLSQKAIKRIGAVDMGTLTWSSNSGEYPTNSFYSTDFHDAKGNTRNIISNGKFNGIYANSEGVIIARTDSDEKYDSNAAFKAAMSGVMLYYELSTPVETAITPPLQALQTFKGFTSFSAPNSLMQNGPLSITYYAEGGTNPEKGWLTSYKRKLYMGRNIEWNQLFTNSVTSSNGVTISNNQDGTITLNGTANKTYINFTNLSDAMNQVHKYLLCLKILNNPDSVSFSYGWLNRYRMQTDVISNGESCTICNQTETLTQGEKGNGLAGFAAGTVFNNVKIAVMVMDLTQMFGAGNEPSTPEEFWSYFDHKLYPYNAGETQPLFKISRKSQWGTASLYDYTFDETMGVLTLNKAPHSQSGDTLTIL